MTKMVFPSREIVEQVRQQYPKGCRVVLEEMDDALSRIRDNTSYQDL